MHPLVDAFYKGRSSLKKVQGKYFDKLKNPRKACHLGTIYYGLYGRTDMDARLEEEYPILKDTRFPIPCEHQYDEEHRDDPTGELRAILIHLNDEHNAHSWPDKRVAEWMIEILK
jgi:hypothetical protein